MFAMLMGLKSIAPRELHGRIGQGGVTLIEVNARHSWLKARVPGALNLAADFDAAMLPADPSAPLVFYCSNPCAARRRRPRAARKSLAMRTCA